jgi:hypothetical protein
MIYAAVWLIPLCTPPTSWQHVVAPEFAFSARLAGLQLTIATEIGVLMLVLMRSFQPGREQIARLPSSAVCERRWGFWRYPNHDGLRSDNAKILMHRQVPELVAEVDEMFV